MNSDLVRQTAYVSSVEIQDGTLNCKALLKKYVCITFNNNNGIFGWVQSIDPLSQSLILLKFSEESKTTVTEAVFVPGYNIKNINILNVQLSAETEMVLDNMFKKEEVVYSKEIIDSRREALCVWLSDNRVPYTVNSGMGIEVLQTATILPPYTTESVQCRNEVVLDKVIKLVTTAPGLSSSEMG